MADPPRKGEAGGEKKGGLRSFTVEHKKKTSNRGTESASTYEGWNLTTASVLSTWHVATEVSDSFHPTSKMPLWLW